ncbi:MAG TPA: hypothetical protein VGF98_02210 [Candidatus Tumulicola sp.]
MIRAEELRTNRISLARMLTNRLIREGRISKARRTEFNAVLAGIFEQARLEVGGFIVSKLRDGEPVRDPEAVF